MRKKRNKFLVFLFSLLPGAGHMFMGFMKTGLSLMSAFLFVVFLATWLDLSPLIWILPLIWFYSFFDSMNRRSASDEDFALLNDSWLFQVDKLASVNNADLQKYRLYAGILLLILGVYMLCKMIIHSMWRFIPEAVYSTVINTFGQFPQIIAGIVIVIIGIRLISGRKRERGNDV